MTAKYDVQNPQSLKRLVAGGALLRPFPQEVMEASYKSANEIYAEIAATNAHFKKMLDSLTAFRSDEYLWWQVAEYSFDTFMIRTRTRLSADEPHAGTYRAAEARGNNLFVAVPYSKASTSLSASDRRRGS